MTSKQDKSISKAKSSGFKFRRYDTIGDVSAESDNGFLNDCFIDTGALSLLRNMENSRSVILGRTGSGKTALMQKLPEYEDRVVHLDPHAIALSYLANSSVLQFFEALDVRMDPFYRFLWRHLFVVEMVKMRFELAHEADKPRGFENLMFGLLHKSAYKEAFNYLQKWGTSFVKTTEERVIEDTRKLEVDLQASVGINIADLMKFGAEGVRQLSREQRSEISQRGQEIINGIQINQLSVLFNALNEDILADSRKHYFLTIDCLDENWIDDATRYRLIKTLIEMMRDFNSKIRHGKIIIALRVDLFHRVLLATTDAGFQDEKYRSLCLPITWDRKQLEQVLNARVNEMIKRQYTDQQISCHDLLPNVRTGKQVEKGIDYLTDRTLLRPRDIIRFFNLCIQNAEGEPKISMRGIRRAEATYSQERLRSLLDEWSALYPYLSPCLDLLRRHGHYFRLGDITIDELETLCLQCVDGDEFKLGKDSESLESFYRGKASPLRLRVSIAHMLYSVGAAGLKTGSQDFLRWSYQGSSDIPLSDITDDSRIHVHKMLWRTLGLVEIENDHD